MININKENETKEVIRDITKARLKRDKIVLEAEEDFKDVSFRKSSFLNTLYQEDFGRRCTLTNDDGETRKYIFQGFRATSRGISYKVYKIKKNGKPYSDYERTGTSIEANKILFDE